MSSPDFPFLQDPAADADLGALFGAPADASPEPGADSGLGDLFMPPGTSDVPAEDTQAAEEAIRLQPRTKELPDVLGAVAAAAPVTQTPPPSAPSGPAGTDQPGVSATGWVVPPAPVEQPAEQPAATPPAAPAQPAGPAGAHSTADQSGAGAVHTAATAPVAREVNRKFTESARLWPIVDQVLAVAGADPTLQAKSAALEFTRNLDVDAAQRADLFETLKPRLAMAGVQIPDPRDVLPVLQMAYDEIVGISVLGDLWRDPDITEVMVDRWDSVVIETAGRLEKTQVKFRNAEHASSVARALALRVSDRAVSNSIPLVTAELPQARVQFAYGPVVKGGLSITMRKFKPLLTLEQLIGYGSMNEQMVEFLKDAVEARSGVLVSGGTGTGKTTIINLLSSFIPDSERVITIEDAFELLLANTHVVSLQTKEAASLDDSVNVSLADLLRSTLRMRPDRIVVGEIREGEGASVMLAAANTGHDGTMTTIHANSASLALNERFVDLIRQVRASSDDVSIRRTITAAFDLVVQVTRGRGGRRYISEIASVDNVDDRGLISLHPVFKAVDDAEHGVMFTFNGVLPGTGLAERLDEKGVLNKWTARQS